MFAAMSRRSSRPPELKKTVLRAAGALHAYPELVKDAAFVRGGVFDREDIAQVMYDMLRRHRVENMAVAGVARSFGASRQAFYVAEALFDSQGIPGLVPKRRGDAPMNRTGLDTGFLADQHEALRREALALSPEADRRRAAGCRGDRAA